MNTNIDRIQKEINELFGKYKIPAITKNLPMDNLHVWSNKVAKHFNLDVDNFQKTVAELFWSVAHIQLSLGYALIARENCQFPKGTNGQALQEEDIPNAILMPEIHFWYHIYNSYECIYRCWERITSVIKGVCYPQALDKLYFDALINQISKDKKYNKNHHLSELKKQIKHWNGIAAARNEISHGQSSPFRNMDIKGKVSNLLDSNGNPIICLDYSVRSPKREIEQVVDKYRKVLPGIKVTKDFIDNIK